MTVKLEFAKSPLGGAKFGGTDKAVLIQEVPFTPGFDLRVNPDSPAFLAVVAALGLVLPTTVDRLPETMQIASFRRARNLPKMESAL